MSNLKEFLKSKQNLKGFKEEKNSDVIGLDIDIMKQDHANGVQIGDDCMVNDMREHFAWMRGHQNCWTGFPNDGKTEFTLFMMIVKALKSKWKWVIWSPEMKGANFVDGKIKVHYNILAYSMMSTITGKTPYKHIHEKYHIPFMTIDEIREMNKWIEEHFIFLDPKETKIDDIYNLLKRVFDKQGFDGVLIDPFKNIEPEPNKRDDQHLHQVFKRFKEFAIETNSVMNWVAHPKSGVTRVDNNGDLNPCNQYMLSGGAAWDNSMDGIYSIQRPSPFDEFDGNLVTFHNLKQRMQELVCQRGKVENIKFDIKTRRYIFNGNDPLSSSVPIEKFPEVESNFEHAAY